MAINRERLAATFTELCEISSPSRKEGAIAACLREKFTALGADSIFEDSSAAKTGSESGNLIVRFNGNLPDREGLFLSCHMDTVEPANGVEVLRTGDIFTSKGETVLGGDDKSGIAAILELLELLKENQSPHPMIEVVITTCEEIGLLGAKHLEYKQLKTKYGYALDSSGIDHVVVGAPAANKITVVVKGLAAHAGLCPEAGINALALAARALNSLRLGRLDEESSRNFGIIQGGVATNIVPEQITLKGEVRSHSIDKLSLYTKEILETFERTVANWQGNPATGDKRPSIKFDIIDDYPALTITDDTPVIKRIKKATQHLEKTMQYIVAGGGSDANIFCGYGLPTAIIATGMNKVHTVDEQLDLNDLVSLTELLH
ncbi:MAG: M20/M25/M40 family metallo-hydrolase, partial [Proteobacteria bacterium]|nr:M20/M25/M40 family metallo-hydrolase [Pseudomonadota bacterium]